MASKSYGKTSTNCLPLIQLHFISVANLMVFVCFFGVGARFISTDCFKYRFVHLHFKCAGSCLLVQMNKNANIHIATYIFGDIAMSACKQSRRSQWKQQRNMWCVFVGFLLKCRLSALLLLHANIPQTMLKWIQQTSLQALEMPENQNTISNIVNISQGWTQDAHEPKRCQQPNERGEAKSDGLILLLLFVSPFSQTFSIC